MTRKLASNILCFLAMSLFLSATMSSEAQEAEDSRVSNLQRKILAKIPDIKHTRPALGRTEERPQRALEHARAIVAAADKHAPKWEHFGQKAGWTAVDPRNDLPALIAAITFKESAFQPVVRLDDNSKMYKIPAKIAAGRAAGKTMRVDAGVMQVRVPSAPGRKCGVANRKDIRRLVQDLSFAYEVGTCVLTNRLTHYVPKYTDQKQRKLRWGQRPARDLQYFGIIGKRKGTPEILKLQELLVIERYNWGGANLHNKSPGAGYARRVLTLFEYFRGTINEA